MTQIDDLIERAILRCTNEKFNDTFTLIGGEMSLIIPTIFVKTIVGLVLNDVLDSVEDMDDGSRHHDNYIIQDVKKKIIDVYQ